MYCRSCKRDLRTVTDDQCPNCHTAFDPMDRRTFRRVLWGRVLRTVAVVVMSLAVGWLAAFIWINIDPYFYSYDKKGAVTGRGAMIPMWERGVWAIFVGFPVGCLLMPAALFFVNLYERLARTGKNERFAQFKKESDETTRHR